MALQAGTNLSVLYGVGYGTIFLDGICVRACMCACMDRRQLRGVSSLPYVASSNQMSIIRLSDTFPSTKLSICGFQLRPLFETGSYIAQIELKLIICLPLSPK